MKKSLYQKEIDQLFKLLRSITPRKTVLPILQCAHLLERSNGRLVMQVTDLSQTLEIETPANARKGFDFVINLKSLEALLLLHKEWPVFSVIESQAKDTFLVQLKSIEKEIIVTSDMPANDFPFVEFEEDANFQSLSFDDISRLKTLAKFVSDDENRNLNAINIEADGTAIGCNGHYLLHTKLAFEGTNALIKPEAIDFAYRNGTNLKVCFDASYAILRGKNFTYKNKLIKGSYVQWQKVLPPDDATIACLNFNQDQCLEIIKEYETLYKVKNGWIPKGIGLHLRDKKLFLHSLDEGFDFEKELQYQNVSECKDFQFGFTIEYLKDILALGQVEFCFHNGNTKTASFSCVEYKGVIEVRKHEK